MDKNQQFLAENAKQEGVQITDSGLQYKVLRDAEGPKPEEYAEVEVHYEGRLVNGKVFDSSYTNNTPISFLLGQVITGWREGLQLMSVGSKYQFVIPAELAYGTRGVPGSIPQNAALIFDVELLKIF